MALEAFSAAWGGRFPQISGMWRAHWTHVTPFFDYPPELRKVISRPTRGAFPTPDSVRKVLYSAIMKASERWTRPVQDWTAALNHLFIVFEGRIPV